MRLLAEAGFVAATEAEMLTNRFVTLPIRMTMAGHGYLDTIRDEEVWRRTKESTQAVGSFSLNAGEG